MTMARCGSVNRSVQELNNRNNLATIRLGKELAEHDRRKKYSIEHIDKCRVDAYSFLKQLQVCNSNLVPAYKELLDGVGTRAAVIGRPRHLDSTLELLQHSSSPRQQGQQSYLHKKQITSRVTRTQFQLLRIKTSHRSNQERVELFLEYLRERKAGQMKEQSETGSEIEDTSKTVLNYSCVELSSPAAEGSREKWTQKTSKGFYSLGRLKVVSGDDKPCAMRYHLVPTITQTFPDVINTIKGTVVEKPSMEGPRVMTRRPLDRRLQDFYSTLDRLKREQNERLAGLPLWEKRRRWLQLTKGGGEAYLGGGGGMG